MTMTDVKMLARWTAVHTQAGLIVSLAVLQRLPPVLVRRRRESFGRNQQCAVEWIDDPCHEGAAVLAAKLTAYKATTVESRFS
jgi:hypothetical protein